MVDSEVGGSNHVCQAPRAHRHPKMIRLQALQGETAPGPMRTWLCYWFKSLSEQKMSQIYVLPVLFANSAVTSTLAGSGKMGLAEALNWFEI